MTLSGDPKASESVGPRGGGSSHRRRYFYTPKPRGLETGDPPTAVLNGLMSLIESACGMRLSFHDLSGVTYLVPELSLDRHHCAHESAFCRLVKSSRRGFARCVRDKYLSNYLANRRRQSWCGRCYLGVVDIVHPVWLDDELVGAFYLGSVRERGQEGRPAQGDFADLRGPDGQTLAEAWEALPQVDAEALDRGRELLVLAEAVLQQTMSLYSIHATTLRRLGRRKASPTAEQGLSWIVDAAVDYIEANYDRDLTLATAADHLRVRPAYLSRVFSRLTGEHFTTAVHRRRIEAAKQLLSETDRSITQVGFDVGFNGSSYFSRVFKRLVGQPPQLYRERFERP